MKKMLILLIVSLIPLKSFATNDSTLEQDIGYCHALLIVSDEINLQRKIQNSFVNNSLKETRVILQLKSIDIDMEKSKLFAQNYIKTFLNVYRQRQFENENELDAGYKRVFKIGWNSCAKLEISGFEYIE